MKVIALVAQSSTGRQARRLVAAVALAAGIGVAIWVHREGMIELDPRALRAQIEALGWMAPLAFVLATALRPFLALPSWVLMSAGGLLFGVVGGTAFGVIGFTLGGVLSFGIARALGRDAVAGRLSGGLAKLDAYLERTGPRWISIYSSLPVTPLTPAYVTAGLSAMSALGFTLAAVIGLVPRTLLFSYFGDSFAQGDTREIVVAVVVVLVAAAIGTVIARRTLAQHRAEADAGPPAAGDSSGPRPPDQTSAA